MVEECRCVTWRHVAEQMYKRMTSNTWHEMQMSDKLRAPAALSPGKGPLLPIGRGGWSETDIVQ
jgi:hypothetical protein